jgi:hypothetical protein
MKYMKVMYDDERVKMLMEGEWYEGIDFWRVMGPPTLTHFELMRLG